MGLRRVTRKSLPNLAVSACECVAARVSTIDYPPTHAVTWPVQCWACVHAQSWSHLLQWYHHPYHPVFIKVVIAFWFHKKKNHVCHSIKFVWYWSNTSWKYLLYYNVRKESHRVERANVICFLSRSIEWAIRFRVMLWVVKTNPQDFAQLNMLMWWSDKNEHKK